MISYIIPHRNRSELLRANLCTLRAQTDKNFEIIIVDNSDLEEAQKVRNSVRNFQSQGIKIKAIFISPEKHPLSHPINEWGGGYNPAYAQNVGVLNASGDIICLTSPEVINAKTNVEEAHRIFSDGKSKFVLGWIDEKPLGAFPDLTMGITADKIKEVCRTPGNGAMCRPDVPHRPWLPINYFLGFLRKDDFIKIGGVDERFMKAIGWEDDFFSTCCDINGFPAQLEESIVGSHLWHSRSYHVNSIQPNRDLWNHIKSCGETIANVGREWGSSEYITGRLDIE